MTKAYSVNYIYSKSEYFYIKNFVNIYYCQRLFLPQNLIIISHRFLFLLLVINFANLYI